MSKRASHKESAQVVSLDDYAKSSKKSNKQRILTLDLWKEKGRYSFSYTMNKHGKRKPADDFVAYALTCVVEDVVSYEGEDPANIMELTQEIMLRLGFEVDDDESE